VAIAIVTACAVPLFSTTARATMEVPAWRVGDFWLYDFAGASGPTPGGTGTLRYEVLGTESVTVAGISYQAYHANLTFTVIAGSLTLTVPGDAWFRTSDLSPVKTTFTITIDIGGGNTFTEIFTVTYNPPVAMQWPLTANAQWSVSSVVTTVIEIVGQPPQTSTGTLSATLRVDPDETRTVPAGTFTTTPVTQTDSSTRDYQRSYWSRAAGNPAEQRSFASNDTETGSMKLRSYRYTPSSGGGGGGAVLGLPPIVWAVIILVVIVGVVALLAMRRRRPAVPAAYPPGMAQAPMTPQAPPPMPPSQPGGPPPPP